MPRKPQSLLPKSRCSTSVFWFSLSTSPSWIIKGRDMCCFLMLDHRRMNCWLVQRHVEVVADDGFKKREYVPNYPEDSPRQLIFFSLAGFAVKDGGKSIIKTCRCVSLAKLWFVQPSQSVTAAFAEVIYARFVLNVRSTQWAALPALVGNYQKNIHRLFPTDIDMFVVQHWGTQKRTHIWVNDFPIGPRTLVTASGCPHSLQWRQSTVGSHAKEIHQALGLSTR